VGMGPYVPHETAPVGDTEFSEEDRLDLSLNMIALLRLMLPEINIAATTALQALDPRGRERALKVGANVMMPVVTPQKYRSSYQLYANKPCVHESPGDCQNCITRRVKSAGFVPALGQRGDSLHYVHRTDHVDS
ncbi:MAG: [FeFe] hydrogenase H-cluster radical SAM maturase HydE, partial [Planctomycetota bacterium]